MCMQDLAIQQRVTWRPLPNLESLGNNLYAVPPNPNRVALYGGKADGSGPQPVYLTPDSFTQLSEVTATTATGGVFWETVLTMARYPGIFNGPLYLSDTDGTPIVYEAIVDTALSGAIQRANAEIGP